MRVSEVTSDVNSFGFWIDRYTDFQRELAELINRHSLEGDSDTPDWVLAEYLVRSLIVFNAVVRVREDTKFQVPDTV